MKSWLDNKIFVFLGGIVDVVWISLLWYFSSIFIVTTGAASVAMYETVHRRIFLGEGYIFPTYRKAFWSNFKKATQIWLLCLLLNVFLIIDFALVRAAMRHGSAVAALYYPTLVCGFLAIMWQLSVTVYQARFDDTMKGVFLKGAAIAFTNIGWMIFLVTILFGAVYLCRYLLVLAIVLPGGYTCLTHHVFEHIYRKMGWIQADPDKEDEDP